MSCRSASTARPTAPTAESSSFVRSGRHCCWTRATSSAIGRSRSPRSVPRRTWAATAASNGPRRIAGRRARSAPRGSGTYRSRRRRRRRRRRTLSTRYSPTTSRRGDALREWSPGAVIPPTSTAPKNQIVLSESSFAFDTVAHEMSHALLSAARIRNPGHDGSHTALIMEFWGRYVLLIDVSEARADARASDLDVAERPRPAPRGDAGIVAVRDILCAESVTSDALCRALRWADVSARRAGDH